jgi:APA family basic amino acid/polyamine antiporter
LRKTLSWPHLVALGVGAIVGTGIYTLTGIGADRAGPAVILAFVIAGMVCACAALAYAELATLIPTAGSAYTYTYAVIGESIAWVVGWSLIPRILAGLQHRGGGWSAYLVGWIKSGGIELPRRCSQGRMPAASSTCLRWWWPCPSPGCWWPVRARAPRSTSSSW